jgi:LAO/AO transport system kinase
MFKKAQDFLDAFQQYKRNPAVSRRALAKALTLIESTSNYDKTIADGILNQAIKKKSESIRIGVTGVPGVGKSTFIENFGRFLISKNHRVAVLAVDPSSKISGGSILADKTRMEKLATSDSAFIRPSPSGGITGGVASKTRESIIVCESAGYDVVIVETVGVGQSEFSVASMVDFFIVLILPGSGDELQGIKKGILENAHLIIVHKADGDYLREAQITQSAFNNTISFQIPVHPSWQTKVICLSSILKDSYENVYSCILDFIRIMKTGGELNRLRKSQYIEWMGELIQDEILFRFYNDKEISSKYKKIKDQVLKERINPAEAARELLDIYFK